MKSILQRLLPHIIAFLSFVIISSIYFSPLLGDKKLRQGDIAHFKGMAQEILEFREEYNEDPLWVNSMFSGMPAYQISVKYNNLIREMDTLLKFGLPRPIAYLMMCMLGFYILFLCLKINPWVSIPFAIIAGLSTIHILYLGAGHMSKVRAISYMAPFIGGLIYAFRRHAIKGAVIATFFLALHITSNHLQMTYYLLILSMLIVIGEVIRLILAKKSVQLPKILGALIIGSIIAVLPSINGMYNTYSYGKYTMRGESKLTIQPQGKTDVKKNKKGLEKDYILQYSLGKGEVLSLLVPDVKGGAVTGAMANSEVAMEVMNPDYKGLYGQMSDYWGEQNFTAGAFYFGAFFAALFMIALFASKDSIKWPLLSFTVLAMILSMKYAGLTETFIDSFPMFSKFRDTKMMLVGVSIAFPLLGAIFVQEIIDGKIELRGNKLLIAGAGTVVVLYFILSFSPDTLLNSFSKQEELALGQAISKAGDQASFYQKAKFELSKGRAAIVMSDAKRSMLFAFVAIAMVFATLRMKAQAVYIALIAGSIGILDVWGVNKRYLGHEDERQLARYYETEEDNLYPNKVGQADVDILNRELTLNPDLKGELKVRLDKLKSSGEPVTREAQAEVSLGYLRMNSNYRVLNLQNTFNDARTSHYHKSIGGYHGGKLGAYQDIIDFSLHNEIASVGVALRTGINPDSAFNNTPVLNMLNAKYAIYSLEAPALANPKALGNAWFASSLEFHSSNDEIIKALSSNGFNAEDKTLILDSDKDNFKTISEARVQVNEVIRMTSYKSNKIEYEVESNYNRLAVFSEIYFKDGWQAFVNDQEVDIQEVNYLLRAVKVPQGHSKVRFEFKPKLFSTLNMVSLFGSILVFATLLVFFIKKKE